MTAQGLTQATDKMRTAAVPELAIDVFADYYHQLEEGRTGLVPEDTIDPVLDVPALADLTFSDEQIRDALSKTVIIKPNGGLGTSMGLDRAKTLLTVRGARTFLDVIVEQLRATRRQWDVRLPLILMNSFRTHDDSLAALAGYPDFATEGLPADFVQNQEPKLLVDSLEPVSWPADPSLEWCPPGHGDIYVALQTTGLLDRLLEQGFRYLSTSNADNLGAAPDGRIAAWFAASGAGYAPELCRRTAADRKGGHLGRRKSDGRIILRDTAQTPEADMYWFTDEHRHPYFHTNNLWFDLAQLRDVLAANNGLPGLPLIRNRKNVDPTDSSSPEVFQIECAMGAIVEKFDNAQPILVGRDRFLPVKTTNDLLLVRSDTYELGVDYRLRMAPEKAALIDLDKRYYKTIANFDARFPAGVPSVREATGLKVSGDWTFGAGVVVRGDVTLEDPGEPSTVADGEVLAGVADGQVLAGVSDGQVLAGKDVR